MLRKHQSSTALLKPQKVSHAAAEARRLRKLGQYLEAERELSEVWAGVGSAPNVAGLHTREAAEVLLLAGVLTGLLGSARGLSDAQERAKDLLTASHDLFKTIGDHDGAGEALSEQGYCSARVGSFGDAQIYFEQALHLLSPASAEARAQVVLRLAALHVKTYAPARAIKTLEESYESFTDQVGRELCGAFHCSMGGALCSLLLKSGQPEDALKALAELELARDYFQASAHAHYLIIVENNSALALMYLSRLVEAHECLDRAETLSASGGMRGWRLRLFETRARVLAAEGRLDEAESIIEINLRSLEDGEEKGLLSEALTTRGLILTRRGRFEDARADFLRSIEVAEYVGDLAAVERASGQLKRIERMASIEHARTRTFIWRMSDDSMSEAGFRPGRCYRFRHGPKWRDGDIVAAVTPKGRFICYISAASAVHVLLRWSNPKYKPVILPLEAVLIQGVVDLR